MKVEVGHYEVGVELGRGRFGWVSRATHCVLDKPVALKYQPGGLGPCDGRCRRASSSDDQSNNSSTCSNNSSGSSDNKNCVGNKDEGCHDSFDDKLTEEGKESCDSSICVCDHVESHRAVLALEHEASMLARLNHPAVVALLEVLRQPKDNGLYVCLEFLGDTSLLSHVQHKGPGRMEVAAVFRQLLDGLQYLHYNFIIHRDIKPENLMVQNVGGIAIAKIIDLGLAAHSKPGQRMSTNNGRVGTLEYMAPELMFADSLYGPEIDVFSLGCCLYFSLIGEPPFVRYKRGGILGTSAIFGLQAQHEEALELLDKLEVKAIRSMLSRHPSMRSTEMIKDLLYFKEATPPPYQLRNDKQTVQDMSKPGLDKNVGSGRRSRAVVDMQCVHRVSDLVEQDWQAVLDCIGGEPHGPVAGMYNLLQLYSKGTPHNI